MTATEYADALKRYNYLLNQDEIRILQSYEIEEMYLLKDKIDEYNLQL